MRKQETGTIKPPRSYLWFFIGILALAELLLIGVDLYYLLGQEGTAGEFLFDVGLVTVITVGLVLLTYFTVRRTLVRYMDSERRFRELADLSPEGIVEVDATGTVRYANGLALEWFGYDQEDVAAGRVNVLDVISGDEVEQAASNMGAIMKGARLEPRSYSAARMDGTVFPILVSSSPIVEKGEVIGVRTVITDVTRMKEAQEQLRQSQAKYRQLFESSIDGILVVSLTTGMITDANRAFLEMIGYPLDELREKVYAELTPARWHEMEMEILRSQVLEREYSEEYEKEILRKDGAVVPVSVRRWLIKDEGGQPVGMWTILRDITDRKRREEEIERANAELMSYAETVSHDLKGPINEVAMAGETVQMLLGMESSPESERYLEDSFDVLRHGINRATDLIDDMLVLAESGQVPRTVEDVRVSEKVAEVIRERSADIEIGRIEVRLDDDLGVIRASPTHIYQIFSNLIKNAIAYGGSSEPVIEVRRIAPGVSGSHRYLVRDNGPGIPTNLIDGIFAPFAKGTGGQTGIGLAIVQRLTDVYGGSIRVRNDGGACFELELNDYSG